MNQLEQLYYEIEYHLLNNSQPSTYFNQIYSLPNFQLYPFALLYQLKYTEQSKKYHPEGNVWNHTMLVIDQAAKVKDQSKNSQAFMWAALLHDIGKPSSTIKKGKKFTSYNHDIIGQKLAKEFLEVFSDDQNFIDQVSLLVRWHMQILLITKGLPNANIKEMKHQVDIEELALLGMCDRLGRLDVDVQSERKSIQTFLEMCKEEKL